MGRPGTLAARFSDPDGAVNLKECLVLLGQMTDPCFSPTVTVVAEAKQVSPMVDQPVPAWMLRTDDQEHADGLDRMGSYYFRLDRQLHAGLG